LRHITSHNLGAVLLTLSVIPKQDECFNSTIILVPELKQCVRPATRQLSVLVTGVFNFVRGKALSYYCTTIAVTRRTLLPRYIIIFMFLILISVRG
jgi:hypothetical protein